MCEIKVKACHIMQLHCLRLVFLLREQAKTAQHNPDAAQANREFSLVPAEKQMELTSLAHG